MRLWIGFLVLLAHMAGILMGFGPSRWWVVAVLPFVLLFGFQLEVLESAAPQFSLPKGLKKV